jgi:hypothetical protein
MRQLKSGAPAVVNKTPRRACRGLAAREGGSIVRIVVGSRAHPRDARRERGEERKLQAAAAPATVSGELPLTTCHWGRRSGKAEGTL